MKADFRDTIRNAAVVMLIFLWTYAAASKLLNYEQSRMQMLNQILPEAIKSILVWALPFSELLIAGLLLFPISRNAGLLLSAILLILFSVYILMVMLNAFERVPCSCGGIISTFGWGQHLAFNLTFLALALIGLKIDLKERRPYE